MKVKELIEYLQKQLDPNEEIGFIGHFGEFVPLTTKSHLHHRQLTNSSKRVIQISPPDFGPEPD